MGIGESGNTLATANGDVMQAKKSDTPPVGLQFSKWKTVAMSTPQETNKSNKVQKDTSNKEKPLTPTKEEAPIKVGLGNSRWKTVASESPSTNALSKHPRASTPKDTNGTDSGKHKHHHRGSGRRSKEVDVTSNTHTPKPRVDIADSLRNIQKKMSSDNNSSTNTQKTVQKKSKGSSNKKENTKTTNFDDMDDEDIPGSVSRSSRDVNWEALIDIDDGANWADIDDYEV